MPCCGQRRESLNAHSTPGVSVSAAPRNWPQTGQAPRESLAAPRRPFPGAGSAAPGSANANPRRDVALRFTETSRIVVEGAVTRRRYEFSGSEPVKLVDSADARALLGTRFFVRG
jgi:hypothetical protein